MERVDDLWCHCARSNEFGQSLRAKISVAGPSVADFWDVDNKQTPPPPDFKSVCFNAMCQVRGVYMVKASMLLFD